MLPLPSRLQLEALAVAGALAFGWYMHVVWTGYLENEGRKDAIELHNQAVAKDEGSGLLFGATLNAIAATTTASLMEIPHADLKPKTVTVYVDRPGPVECPARSQWTPDLVRLWNGDGPAPAGGADGSLRPLQGAAPPAGGVPGAPAEGAERGGGADPHPGTSQ